jgi:hypothetical protein
VISDQWPISDQLLKPVSLVSILPYCCVALDK